MSPALVVLAGFLLGSIPWSWLVVRWRTGRDLAVEGSRNVGAVNARNVSGSQALGLLALVLDLAKGMAAVEVARLAGADRVTGLIAGAAAVLGHVFNPWLSWRRGRLAGGKGFATSAGALLRLAPWLVVVWLGVVLVAWLALRATRGIRDDAPASAFAMATTPLTAWLLYDRTTFWVVLALVLVLLTKLRREAIDVLRAPR